MFKLAPDGTQNVLYNFCSQPHCADGAGPKSLILASSGNLYGTTQAGVGPHGIVFALAPAGTQQTLYTFCAASGCADGADPTGQLLVDKAGNFYGATAAGGASNNGTVYELTRGGAERVLYSFCALANCADGTLPTGGLIMDAAGNLYGTTAAGGITRSGYSGVEGGTVFKLMRQ